MKSFFLFKKILLLFIVLYISFNTLISQNIDPAALPPYVHPPIFHPIQDGVKQEIPKELGNQKFASYGVVDVTAAPFYADPAGKKDSTKALQRAIDFARDNQMVCFFPSGTYTISDTLYCRHGLYLRSYYTAIFPFELMPCFLLGSRTGQDSASYSRPKIVLADNSKGFADPEKKKYVIDYIIYNVENKRDVDTSPSSYVKVYNFVKNAAFINIDIEIGKGNSGAVGIRFNTAEGSVMQDVKIDATNGYIGIDGASGNGGNWANLTVIGGEIGLDMREYSVPTPTMVGITLIGQRKAAIMSKVRGSLTIVGLKIISNNEGPLIIAQKRWDGTLDGTMNIIDGEVIFENLSTAGKKNIVIDNPERSIYLNNFYAKNADEVVKGYCNGIKNNWIKVKEFAIGIDFKFMNDKISSPIYINGEKKNNVLSEVENNVLPPADLISNHLWNTNFPHFEMKNIANVKDSPYNAKGDSFTDDTIAIQKAIDENEYVFLPKGYYRITKTIKLKPNTKLIGIAQHLSVIMVRDPEGYFGDIKNPHPMVETADDSNAETILAFCYIAVPEEAELTFNGEINPVFALKWMAGEKSIFRSVCIDPMRVYGYSFRKDRKKLTFKYPHILITGNGGGKWYNLNVEALFRKNDASFLIVLIEGTSSPLYFYNFEPQYTKSSSTVEVNKSKNISFFGCKTEGNSTFIYFKDSKAFRVIGHGGTGSASTNGYLYRFDNCRNFIFVNLTDQINFKEDIPHEDSRILFNYKKFFPIKESFFGKTRIVPSDERPVIYKRM